MNNLNLDAIDQKLAQRPVLWNKEFRYNLLKASGQHNAIGRNVWDNLKNPNIANNDTELMTESYLDDRQKLEDVKTQVRILESLQTSNTLTRTLPPLIPTHQATSIMTMYFKVGRNATLVPSTVDDLWLVMIVFFVSGTIGVTYRLPKSINYTDEKTPTSTGFDMNVLRRNMKIVTDILYNIPGSANISNQTTFLQAYKRAKRQYLKDIRRSI